MSTCGLIAALDPDTGAACSFIDEGFIRPWHRFFLCLSGLEHQLMKKKMEHLGVWSPPAVVTWHQRVPPSQSSQTLSLLLLVFSVHPQRTRLSSCRSSLIGSRSVSLCYCEQTCYSLSLQTLSQQIEFGGEIVKEQAEPERG